jgi:hypothetical protein
MIREVAETVMPLMYAKANLKDEALVRCTGSGVKTPRRDEYGILIPA